MPGPSVAVRIFGDLTSWAKSVSGAADNAQTGTNRMKSAFSGALSVLNKTGVLGPFEGAVDAVGQAFDSLSTKGASAGEKLLGAGGAIAGLGVGLQALGSKQQAAQQQLSAAIEATGGSYDQYSSAISKAIGEEEHHGETATETMNALQTLTQAMHSPQKAIEALGTASDVAAAKHEDLGTAATQMGMAYNGSAKLLKSFGISSTLSLKQVDEEMASLGSTSDVAKEQHISLAAAAKLLQKAHDGNTAALKKLGLATKVQGTDALGELADMTRGQATAASDTFTGHLDALKAKVEDTVTTFAVHYGPAITAAGSAMAGVGAAMEVAKGAQEALKDSTVLATAATKAQELAQAALNLIMDANPILLVVVAIAALVAAFVLAYQHITIFRNAINDVWNAIKVAFDFIVQIVKDAFGFIEQYWPLLLGVLTGPFGLMLAVVITHWNDVETFLKTIPGKIGDIFKGAVQWLQTAGSDIINGLWTGIDKVWQTVWGFFTDIAGKIVGEFKGAVDWLQTAGSDILNGLWTGISNIWTSVITFFSGVKGTVTGYFDKAVTWLEQAGKDILNGLVKGIKAVADAPVKAVEKVVTDVKNLPGKILHALSPSRVFEDYGRWTMEGFANGITGAASSATDAVSNAMTAVTGVGPPAAVAAASSASGPLVSFGDVTITSGADMDTLTQQISAVLTAGRL